MSKKKKISGVLIWKNVTTVFVLISLLGSIVYSVVNIIRATPGAIPETEHGKLRSDYVLMLVQCVLGVTVMFLPSFIGKKLKLEIANWIYLTFVIFLYCAIYLGEVRSFYTRVEHWDTILHIFSGGMLGALGFFVVNLLDKEKAVSVNLSPVFVAVFAFCFALTLETIWEMYEFMFDGLLGLNMQKHSLEDGTALVGRMSLSDTMKDLIVGALGALIVTVSEYIYLKRSNSRVAANDDINNRSSIFG